MTPKQKIKHAIIAKTYEWMKKELPFVTDDNIDELYDDLFENDDHWDAMNEIREGEVETDLPCEYSRHFETKSVAAKMPDGSWVGWTYYYGGGKHAEPEAIEWISCAYDLDCKEEKKTVIVRTFTKVGEVK
jgi:hypothetical protein